jgi:hypothetical protein
MNDDPDDPIVGTPQSTISLSDDSTWGEGAASALQSLKQIERRRERSKPKEERPSGE